MSARCRCVQNGSAHGTAGTDNDDRGTSLAMGTLRGALRIPPDTVGRVVLYIDVPYSAVREIYLNTVDHLCNRRQPH